MPKTDLPDVHPDEIIIAVAENYSGLYKEDAALCTVTDGDSELLRLFAPSKSGDISSPSPLAPAHGEGMPI